MAKAREHGMWPMRAARHRTEHHCTGQQVDLCRAPRVQTSSEMPHQMSRGWQRHPPWWLFVLRVGPSLIHAQRAHSRGFTVRLLSNHSSFMWSARSQRVRSCVNPQKGPRVATKEGRNLKRFLFCTHTTFTSLFSLKSQHCAGESAS